MISIAGRLTPIALVLLGLGMSVPPAMGGILQLTGDIVLESAIPSDLRQGHWESATEMSLFSERLDVTLEDTVGVDITEAGTYDTQASLTAGDLASGLSVDSWLVHIDHAAGAGIMNLSGSITFDADVLGIMVKSVRMGQSDDVLGALGTRYAPGASARGLEFNEPDMVVLSEDRRTVWIDMRVQSFLDEIRVVTAASISAVPGGGGLALLIPWFVRHRRRK